MSDNMEAADFLDGLFDTEEPEPEGAEKLASKGDMNDDEVRGKGDSDDNSDAFAEDGDEDGMSPKEIESKKFAAWQETRKPVDYQAAMPS